MYKNQQNNKLFLLHYSFVVFPDKRNYNEVKTRNEFRR
jgi:hypothetical protein